MHIVSLALPNFLLFTLTHMNFNFASPASSLKYTLFLLLTISLTHIYIMQAHTHEICLHGYWGCYWEILIVKVFYWAKLIRNLLTFTDSKRNPPQKTKQNTDVMRLFFTSQTVNKTDILKIQNKYFESILLYCYNFVFIIQNTTIRID